MSQNNLCLMRQINKNRTKEHMRRVLFPFLYIYNLHSHKSIRFGFVAKVDSERDFVVMANKLVLRCTALCLFVSSKYILHIRRRRWRHIQLKFDE